MADAEKWDFEFSRIGVYGRCTTCGHEGGVVPVAPALLLFGGGTLEIYRGPSPSDPTTLPDQGRKIARVEVRPEYRCRDCYCVEK